MDIEFGLKEAVVKRYSVRNYASKVVEEEKVENVVKFMKTLENPFGKKINFHFLNQEGSNENQKIGTYGVIKGARNYIGTTIQQGPFVLEALGYEFEALVLYLTHLGLGSCWLGGTFDRKEFTKAIQVKEGELLPIISPYGYAAEKKHITEIAMRKLIKADQRKPWKELFFYHDFTSPLSEEEAEEFAYPFEMVRLGPSASNKQPWRIILGDHVVHFFEQKEEGYSKAFAYDIQRVDIGIAAAHFDFAVKEQGMDGEFVMEYDHGVPLLNNMEYGFSWIKR